MDNLSEHAVRPWDRKAAVNQGVATKLLQGFMLARGGVKYDDGVYNCPNEQDAFFLCDGGRESLQGVLPGTKLWQNVLVLGSQEQRRIDSTELGLARKSGMR